MKKNVILADYDVSDSWEYKLAIEESTKEEWSIEKCITNKYHGSKWKTLIRYGMYFAFSFGIFLKRNNYVRIIAWQQFFGLILAFFCRLFKVKNAPEIYVMTFIYKPKNKFYKKFMEYIVKSGYITRFIVLSDGESAYYSKLFGIDEDMFYCTRIGVPDISQRIPQKEKMKKYYLAVGRSNRDYRFLRDVWKKDYGELVIICDAYEEPEKEGITCLRNCYGNEYLEYVANCYAQIIPLSDTNISAGSLSFVQAMMLSRPSIVTENTTVHDYLKSTYNGLIIDKTEEALTWAIDYLNDQDNYSKICKNARNDYIGKFSERSLGLSIGKMLTKV